MKVISNLHSESRIVQCSEIHVLLLVYLVVYYIILFSAVKFFKGALLSMIWRFVAAVHCTLLQCTVEFILLQFQLKRNVVQVYFCEM